MWSGYLNSLPTLGKQYGWLMLKLKQLNVVINNIDDLKLIMLVFDGYLKNVAWWLTSLDHPLVEGYWLIF